MGKIVKIMWLIISLQLFSCNSKKSYCDEIDFKDLNLYPVNCIIEFPEYIITDSMRFDPQTILSYNLKALDSSVSMTLFVNSYEKELDGLSDINIVMGFQKHEAEFGRDSLKQLAETFKTVENIKVGYLKYLVQNSTKRFYEGRIFFYRGRKLVLIWLFENYTSEKQNDESVIDCILENMRFEQL